MKRKMLKVFSLILSISMLFCLACTVVSADKPPKPPRHEHVWSEWQPTKNGKQHFRVCTDQRCQKQELKSHSFGQYVEDTEKGDHYTSCKDCKYVVRGKHDWRTQAQIRVGEYTVVTKKCKDCNAVYTELFKGKESLGKNKGVYKVEYYMFDSTKNDYVLQKDDSGYFVGELNSTANAQVKDYPHFALDSNKSTVSGKITLPTVKNCVASVLTLKLYYNKDTHKVTFKADNGGTINGQSADVVSTVSCGDAFPAKPNANANTNYTFDGWYDLDGKKVDTFPELVTADLTYVAKFSVKEIIPIGDEDPQDPENDGNEEIVEPEDEEISEVIKNPTKDPQTSDTTLDFAIIFMLTATAGVIVALRAKSALKKSDKR